MGGFINPKPGLPPPEGPSPDALFVDNVRFSNAAAKFWPSLIDEIVQDFPLCSRVELSAPCSGQLEPQDLWPHLAFEREINSLLGQDLGRLFRETVAELELLGPPPSVILRLFAREDEVLVRDLPLECLDAETFTYFVVWLLEWAGIPESHWNDGALCGDIRGEDRERGFLYRIEFELHTSHMSEGLYERRLSFAPLLEAVV